MFGLIQQLQLFHHNFNLAGGDVLVHGALVALAHLADGGHHKFRAQAAGFLVDGGIPPFVENQLGDSTAISEINKNHVAEITAAVDPAHQDNLFPCVPSANVSAHVRATK